MSSGACDGRARAHITVTDLLIPLFISGPIDVLGGSRNQRLRPYTTALYAALCLCQYTPEFGTPKKKMARRMRNSSSQLKRSLSLKNLMWSKSW